MTDSPQQSAPSLATLAGFTKAPHERRVDDQAWIKVIERMDNIYADLVHYQVKLEQKNAELENTQNFVQSVISSISDVLIVCDVNGMIQRVNPELEQVIGLSADVLHGQALATLISDDYREMIADFPEHIRSGSIIDCEIDLLSHDGQAIPMAINCSARYDHKNRLSGFVITGRPLGELRKAYSELRQAHQELKNAQQQLIQSEKLASLGRLVAGVAHELNNPISFLYANMHALKDYEHRFRQYIDAIHAGVDDEQREALRRELKIDHMMDDIKPLVEGSLEGAERVNDIIQNLRRFAMPQQERRSSFDLVTVIRRATSWVLKAANHKPEVITELPQQLIITNNEGHVHQILINLIQNAIDAIQDHPKPQLHISIRQQQQNLGIHIRDNGPGIPKDNLVRIFDPFYTTKAVGSGTGLGLYISYGLATEQCQGDLLAGNHPDGGAEFILQLPMEDKPS